LIRPVQRQIHSASKQCEAVDTIIQILPAAQPRAFSSRTKIPTSVSAWCLSSEPIETEFLVVDERMASFRKRIMGLSCHQNLQTESPFVALISMKNNSTHAQPGRNQMTDRSSTACPPRRGACVSKIAGRRKTIGIARQSFLQPARELMICLGWLRLFQTIVSPILAPSGDRKERPTR